MKSRFWIDGCRQDYEPQTTEDNVVYSELRIVDAQTNFTGYEMQLIEERLRLVYRHTALAAENARLREALERIANGNPAPPGGKWLSDAKMAMIARAALAGGE